MNMGEVQQKPENLAAWQIEKEMVISQTDLKIRSCIICTGAREARIASTTQQGGSLSRQRTSEEEKGMLAEKEKSRRPKVDRFRSSFTLFHALITMTMSRPDGMMGHSRPSRTTKRARCRCRLE